MYKLTNTFFKQDFFKKRNYLILILIILISLGLSFLFNFGGNVPGEEDGYSENWREETITQINHLEEENQKLIEESDSLVNTLEIEVNQDQISRLNYHISNDIKTVSSSNLYGSILNLTSVVPLITLVMIFVSGNMVSKEFSMGTMSLILLRPFSRYKIMLTKFLNTILYLSVYYFSFIFPGTIYSLFFSEINTSTYHVLPNQSGQYIHVNFWEHIAFIIFANLFLLIVISTIAFSLSTITRNSAISSNLTLIAYLTGPLVVSYLERRTSVAKYLPMANWNLTNFISGNIPPAEGMSLSLSVSLNILTIIIFLTIAFLHFEKQDINF